MSLDAMKQALEVLSLELPLGSHLELKSALRAAIKQAQRNEFNPDWDQVEALRESLREHMAEIQRLRQWHGLTDEEREQVINANFATGLWQMAKDIEAKLKEKNT